MIEIHDLTKRYGDKTALNQLNLNIAPGQIFGLLGHNGAGKSTTIKNLVSIIQPTSGTITVDGLDLAQQRLAVKAKISYVPDTPDIFLQLSATEYWDLIAAAYQKSEAAVQQRRQQLVALFDMAEHAEEPMASYSHGMRQKAIVIGALLPDPDIWILDEPMQGLDPQAAFDLKNLMKAHAAKGKTVIFSTHNLDTAKQLCDQLAILKQGQLIYTGTVEALLAQHPQQSLETIYLEMAGRPTNGALVDAIEGEPDE